MPKLSFNYHWHLLPKEFYPRMAREFLDWGVDRFVFQDPVITRGEREPEYLDFLRNFCREMNVSFVSMHAPFGPEYDLNIVEKDRRPGMIRDHVRAMEIAKEFGSETYTIHVGAHHYCTKHIPLEELRKYALDSLEKLVPEAERIGIVLAVENSFEKSNSAKEVLKLVESFSPSPAIGVCYDTGHANCMASAPWKKWENYPDYQKKNWWEGFVTEDGALKLLEKYIVTCHIHDNDGYRDLHDMPGDGTIDWITLVPALKSCPRMLEYQTEVNLIGGTNWAGTSPAPAGGYSIRRLVETFRAFNF